MRQKVANIVIAVVVVLVIAGVVVFGLLRTRWHEHPAPAGGETRMEDSRGNVREHSMGHHDEAAPPEFSGVVENGVRVVRVSAHQFEFVPNEIIVKLGEKVRLEVTSQDVTHGVAIEHYGINRKLNPKQTETVEFVADKPGRRHFHCSVYCGEGHGDMHGELVVLE